MIYGLELQEARSVHARRLGLRVCRLLEWIETRNCWIRGSTEIFPRSCYGNNRPVGNSN